MKTPLTLDEALTNRVTISPREWAELNGISLSSTWQHIREKNIPTTPIGRQHRIPIEWVRKVAGKVAA